jgi:uncharacterized membrane protein
MSLFVLLKIVHILSAITALGANLTYPFWLRRAGHDRARVLEAIDGISSLDRTVANRAYILAFLTGAGMILTGVYSFTTFWVAAAIVLFVTVAVLGITVYAPAFRRQRAEAERDVDSAAYAAIERRQKVIGLVVTLMVVAIVVLMVWKPSLG